MLEDVILAPHAVKRLIEPEEVAGVVAFLLGPEGARVQRRAGHDGPGLDGPIELAHGVPLRGGSRAARVARARALQHRRGRLRQAPARQAGDDLGALRRRAPRAELGRAAGPLQPGGQRAARARRRARATASRSCCRRRPRPRRSSSAPGSSARSCCRCRCSTATTGIRHRLDDSDPSVLVTDEANAAASTTGSARCSSLDDGRCSTAPRPSSRRADTAADDPAQLYYTSGTTGLAKGIVHAHRYILAHEEFVYCHDVQRRRALPRHGRVGVGRGHRAAARARGATARCRSCSSARAASTPSSSSTSSRATRSRTSSRRPRRCAR